MKNGVKKFWRQQRALFLALSLGVGTQAAFAVTGPVEQITPGVVCTAQDADFAGYIAGTQVAYCHRMIKPAEKNQVAKYYNIPRTDYNLYEFDHLIPLCLGGSNDVHNLWPQPIAEAHLKDVLEDRLCIELKAGKITQAEGIQQIHEWFNLHAPPAA